MEITEYLGGDHKHCDELYAQAEQLVADGDWDHAPQALEGFLASMEQHFGMEEQLLFPAFEEATGMTEGPTMVMRMEHEQMRQLFANMRAAATAKDSNAFLGDAETLLILMQQHNLKEEQMLYPMADRALGSTIVPQLQEFREAS